MEEYKQITKENLAEEHLCCAIADKKHQEGVAAKKEWLDHRLPEGHVFYKLDERGKVFIEYAPLEKAWVPVLGENYLYIYCLWVSGKFAGHGHARTLLEHCIAEAKAQGKSGICVLSHQKKKPFLSDGKFFKAFGFEVADSLLDGYELLALSFDGGLPMFAPSAREGKIEQKNLTLYYSPQCPYIPNCVQQVQQYCEQNHVPLTLVAVDSLKKAKELPCLFNNWAVFYRGKFETTHLLNATYLKKLLAKSE